MAKAKKVMSTNKDGEKNNVDDVKGEKSPSREKKPENNLKKSFKARVKAPLSAPVAEMVTAALKSLKNDDGVALVSIRKYISNNYKVKLGKERQQQIKEFIAEEFGKGNIVMTNSDVSAIHFNKKFNMVQ